MSRGLLDGTLRSRSMPMAAWPIGRAELPSGGRATGSARIHAGWHQDGERDMKTIQVAALLSLSVCSVALGQQAVQWKVADGGNGHWYAAIVDAQQAHMPHAVASAQAVQRGAHLVTFSNEAELMAVLSLLPVAVRYDAWIGLVQQPGSGEPDGGWRWVTGEPLAFTHWAAGQPDNRGCNQPGEPQDYGRLVNAGPSWDDHGDPSFACPSGVPRAVIEWSADCNGDGIVDYGQCRDGSLPDYNGNNIPDCCEQGTPCMVGSYPVQWRVSEGGNGHWYRFVPVLTDWPAARAAARSHGADLVSITSAAESEFLRPLGRAPTAWMGAIQAPGGCEPDCEWQWSDGSAWGYQNWDPQSGEPNDGGCCWPSNEDVGEFRFGNGRWNDYLASALIPSLVEWSADCDNDGFVDYGQVLQGQLPDTNTSGVPDACECTDNSGLPVCCVGNLNSDQAVDGADLGILLNAWGGCAAPCAADLNRDGFVDGADLGALLGNWGACP